MTGEKITNQMGKITVPDYPIVPFIEGDGTGPDIWAASVRVLDAAVEKAYKGKKKIVWKEVLAGEKAFNETGQWLPEETLDIIHEHLVAIKGPLTTPVGGGIRSLNVALRQILDLYVCLRPVKYYKGVPSPVKDPSTTDMVIFRENSEDIYAGIEWMTDSAEGEKVKKFLLDEMGVSTIRFPESASIGIKPISREGTSRLVRGAIQYAVRHNLPSVTLVHKGNIMKYTEGAFMNWGYEVAKDTFRDQVLFESDLDPDAGEWFLPEGKVLIKDRIADMMFQQVLLRPESYHVIATPNLNGDYLSDALAAQVGGLGISPGANIGDRCAVFEATHGTAPKYAGLDKANPLSLILSGVMMLEYLGWHEAGSAIERAVKQSISEGLVTYDLARQIPGSAELKSSQFAQALAERLGPS